MAPPVTCECGACRKCKHRIYMRSYYRRNAEVIRRTAIASRAKRAAAVREYDSRRAASRKALLDPAKKRAGKAVHHAVKSGRLVRLPCEVCGEPRTHAHHDDYSKPLDVRWLCVAHHMELHRTVAP